MGTARIGGDPRSAVRCPADEVPRPDYDPFLQTFTRRNRSYGLGPLGTRTAALAEFDSGLAQPGKGGDDEGLNARAQCRFYDRRKVG